MISSNRAMRLTSELVARVPPFVAHTDTGPPFYVPTDDEYRAQVAALRAAAPATGGLWLFGYGSLIWNPACDFVEERTATVSGWRRSFCLGWITSFRGSPTRPGLMLALEREGVSEGIVYRLPPDGEDEALEKLVRREIIGDPPPMVPQWLDVETAAGRVRALTFVISPASGFYVSGLADETVADALATAAGERGTMAEYLHSTVAHLEARGIHDPYLWRLQEMVAERLERGAPV